jgi:hypothetical protein
LAQNVYSRIRSRKTSPFSKITFLSSFLPAFLHPATHHWKSSEAARQVPLDVHEKSENRRKSGTLGSQKRISIFHGIRPEKTDSVVSNAVPEQSQYY